MSPQHLYFRRRHLWWRSIFWWRRLLFVTIAHMKWWRSLSITINYYWWRTLNVTTTPILSAMPPLVTFSFWWRRLFWPSPMSLWWPFSPLTNVLFSCSDTMAWFWYCRILEIMMASGNFSQIPQPTSVDLLVPLEYSEPNHLSRHKTSLDIGLFIGDISIQISPFDRPSSTSSHHCPRSHQQGKPMGIFWRLHPDSWLRERCHASHQWR